MNITNIQDHVKEKLKLPTIQPNILVEPQMELQTYVHTNIHKYIQRIKQTKKQSNNEIYKTKNITRSQNWSAFSNSRFKKKKMFSMKERKDIPKTLN